MLSLKSKTNQLVKWKGYRKKVNIVSVKDLKGDIILQYLEEKKHKIYIYIYIYIYITSFVDGKYH